MMTVMSCQLAVIIWTNKPLAQPAAMSAPQHPALAMRLSTRPITLHLLQPLR